MRYFSLGVLRRVFGAYSSQRIKFLQDSRSCVGMRNQLDSLIRLKRGPLCAASIDTFYIVHAQTASSQPCVKLLRVRVLVQLPLYTGSTVPVIPAHSSTQQETRRAGFSTTPRSPAVEKRHHAEIAEGLVSEPTTPAHAAPHSEGHHAEIPTHSTQKDVTILVECSVGTAGGNRILSSGWSRRNTSSELF